MVSLIYQLTSARQNGIPGLPLGKIAAQWVRFAVTVAAAALNTKPMMLWSESRMLRKVKVRSHRKLRDSLISENYDHAFAELYVSLSKGWHRTYSRYYPLLYYLFIFALDVIDVTEFFAGDSFDTGVTSSEELTAFRLLIYVGSFATFGAVNLTIAQISVLVFCNLAIAILNMVFGYGILRFSRAVRSGLVSLQLTLIGCFVLVWMIQRCGEHRSSLPGIVSRMAYIREENFHDPNLERTDLRKSLSDRQSTRLENMEGLAMKYRNFDVDEARELTNWWSEDFGDFVAFFLVAGLSAAVWGQLSQDQVPRIVFLNCLEAVSTFLLYVNNTVVEKMLFVKLLQIARMPKSGSRNTSSLTEIPRPGEGTSLEYCCRSHNTGVISEFFITCPNCFQVCKERTQSTVSCADTKCCDQEYDARGA